MPKTSGKMNAEERAICAQVKKFRKNIGWNQAAFAQQIGIGYNQLVGIESARTPLQYSTAWKMREVFGVGLTWLSGEGFPLNTQDVDDWPSPDEYGKKRALYSEVYQALHSGAWNIWDRITTKGDEEKRATRREHRTFWVNQFLSYCVEWFTQLPDTKLLEFWRYLSKHAEQYIKTIPKEPQAKIAARENALIWESVRAEIDKRFPTEARNIQDLTPVHASVKSEEVKPLWPLLKKRLQKATAETGGKSKLAEFLGVKLASVSQWLTDKKTIAREPGAETALRMLNWVEQQERK